MADEKWGELIVRADETGCVKWIGVVAPSGEEIPLSGVTNVTLEQEGSQPPPLKMTLAPRSFTWERA